MAKPIFVTNCVAGRAPIRRIVGKS